MIKLLKIKMHKRMKTTITMIRGRIYIRICSLLDKIDLSFFTFIWENLLNIIVVKSIHILININIIKIYIFIYSYNYIYIHYFFFILKKNIMSFFICKFI
jgi:hypothetical protein